MDKDYRTDDDTTVREWSNMWDTSNWAYSLAMSGKTVIGVATVAYRTEGVHMLESRTELGVLWDVRAEPHQQKRGVGRALFESASTWRGNTGLKQLKFETQDVNVLTCRLYERMGCELRGVLRGACGQTYPDETQFRWWLGL